MPDFTTSPTAVWQQMPENAAVTLARLLDGVSPWVTDEGLARSFRRPRWKVLEPPGSPPPWLLLFVLRDVVGCHDLGRHEKLQYELPVIIDGYSLTVAYEKFGLRAYVEKRPNDNDNDNDDGAATAAVVRLMRQLTAATPLVERYILAPRAAEQLKQARVTISNDFSRYHDMYTYFRERSEALAAQSVTTPELEPARSETPSGTVLTFSSIRWELRRKASFDLAAAVASFFSLLEHLLVFALPFANFDPAADDLERFVGDDWSTKFRRVVDISDAEAKRHYDALRTISAQVRNPAVHGGFDRKRSRFHFHFDGIGAVPAQLSRADGQPEYWFDGSAEIRGSEAWSVFDSFLAWVKTGPLRFAWRLSEEGFDVAFDDANRADLISASQCDSAFESYLEDRARVETNAMNMDW